MPMNHLQNIQIGNGAMDPNSSVKQLNHITWNLRALQRGIFLVFGESASYKNRLQVGHGKKNMAGGSPPFHGESPVFCVLRGDGLTKVKMRKAHRHLARHV